MRLLLRVRTFTRSCDDDEGDGVRAGVVLIAGAGGGDLTADSSTLRGGTALDVDDESDDDDDEAEGDDDVSARLDGFKIGIREELCGCGCEELGDDDSIESAGLSCRSRPFEDAVAGLSACS